MIRYLPAVILALLAMPACAQDANAGAGAPPEAGAEAALQASEKAQHDRIAAERGKIETRYGKERQACYSRFAVNDCLNESRRRRRVEVEELDRQEAAINDAERQRRGDAALKRLEAANAKSSSFDAQEHQRKALQDQQERDRRAAEQAASRQQRQADAAASRRDWEDKQRANAAEDTQRQERRQQDAVERARYEEKVEAARRERADLDARNAQRTKPRAAPLPPPPP